MAIDKEKQRARWQRNKKAERKRKSTYPRELSPQLVARVIKERNRRISETPYVGVYWRHADYFKAGSWEKALCFAADVWAADVILKEEWGPKGAKPSRVAAWIEAHGHPHTYACETMRKMIYKARQRIKVLETRGLISEPGRVFWPQFDPHGQY